MKRGIRFLAVLVALLGLMAMTQGALTGSCSPTGAAPGSVDDCPK